MKPKIVLAFIGIVAISLWLTMLTIAQTTSFISINNVGSTINPSSPDLFSVSPTSFNWGIINLGGTVHKSLTITNLKDFSIYITGFDYTNIQPNGCVTSLTWNLPTGYVLPAKSSVLFTFSLTISSNIEYAGKDFSFDITVYATD